MKSRQIPATSILNRACSGFSLLGFWRENRTSLLLAIALLAAVFVLFAWLARRRRHDSFPELRPSTVGRTPESDLGMTQIEEQKQEFPPDPDTASPGLHGKIDVEVQGQKVSSYLVTDNPLPIGRDPGQSLVVIQEPIVSKLHCQVFARGGHVFVRDLNSTNGIYMGDEKISERELQDNDAVFLGKKGTVRIIYHR